MALEPLLRKVGSQNFDTMRPINGYEKSPSFMALAQTVFGTDQKNTWVGADSLPHPTSNKVKPKFYLTAELKKTIIYLTVK